MANELVPLAGLSLTPAQFSELADVPPELEWLANITNAKTRRAYETWRNSVALPDCARPRNCAA
jgi:hypothetical protein